MSQQSPRVVTVRRSWGPGGGPDFIHVIPFRYRHAAAGRRAVAAAGEPLVRPVQRRGDPVSPELTANTS